MEVIPVVDLMQGQVVRAQQGERDSYAPIESPLSLDSSPEAVLEGYFSIYPFSTLYVADLDAILGRGDNSRVIERLGRQYPDTDLWVDSGIAGAAAGQAWLETRSAHLVIGSESQPDMSALDLTRVGEWAVRIILSLDFRGDTFLGPPELLEAPGRWPERLVTMTLSRVGSNQGPDLSRLADIQSRAAGKKVYAAGGVRGPADLVMLAENGVAGALVASALHDGRIGLADIEAAIRPLRQQAPEKK